MATAEPLVPGEIYEVDVEIDAIAWRWAPGHVLRLALAGADWPNVIAPPSPLTLTVHGGELALPAYDPAESPYPTPAFVPGDETADEDASAVTWRTSRDVLARVTGAFVEHGGEPYDTSYGRAGEHYVGEVSVQTQTFTQSALSDVTFSLHYDDDGAGATRRLRGPLAAAGRGRRDRSRCDDRADVHRSRAVGRPGGRGAALAPTVRPRSR